MIQIIFVPGTFGSAVEQYIRCFTNNSTLETFNVAEDGSTHIYTLPYHFRCKHDLTDFLEYYKNLASEEIVSSIYPMADLCSDNVINFFADEQFLQDKKILITINSTRDAELVLLFQYYKQANGIIQKQTDFLFLHNLKDHLKELGENYKTIDDVPLWAVREWFSLYYPGVITTWIDINYDLPDCMTINFTNILYKTNETLKEIFKFCNKSLIKERELALASVYWQDKQQYILNEFNLLEKIVESTVNKISFKWNKLHIIAESIIQSRLRFMGYEIKCYNLNEFPTDSLVLNKLLERP